MSSVVSSFVSSLSQRGVTVRTVDAEEVLAVLESEITPPAVGAELHAVQVDLEALDVEVNTDPTPAELDEAATGITDTTLGIAEYGSVVVRGGPAGQEPASLYPDHHVALVRESDIVADMATAMGEVGTSIRDGNRSHVIATGPSATADMGALVEGAHGPKSVTVVVVTGE